MTTQSAREYVSNLIIEGKEEYRFLTTKQKQVLISYMLEDMTEIEIVDALIENIDPSELKTHLYMLYRNDNELNRGSLLILFRTSIERYLLADMETLFMDELEKHEYENLDFNHLNYGWDNHDYQ